MIRLWTVHPSDFRLDNPQIVIDPKKGKYWDSGSTPYYCDKLPKLHNLLGTDQLIWCFTSRDGSEFEATRLTEDSDVQCWQIELPKVDVIRFLRSDVWSDIIRTGRDRWPELFVPHESFTPCLNIQAIVRFPIRCGSLMKVELPPAMSRSQISIGEKYLAEARRERLGRSTEEDELLP